MAAMTSNAHKVVYEFITAEQSDAAKGPHGWIQWKGTNVCIDLSCDCGTSGHFDGDFFYGYQCRGCGQRYAVGEYVKLIPLTNKEASDYCRDYKTSSLGDDDE